MIVPLAVYGFFKVYTDIAFPETLFYIVAITTAAWLVVTFMTRPTEETTLKSFYRRVHPGGTGWKRIASQMPEIRGDSGYGGLFMNWVAGIVLVYAMLFGIGKLILGQPGLGALFLAIGLGAAGVIYWDLSKRGFETIVK